MTTIGRRTYSETASRIKFATSQPPGLASTRGFTLIKMVALLSRKPGLTDEALRTHYEEVHVPLILSLVGPHLAAYRRNFVDHSTASGGANMARGELQLDFDIITETVYADQSDFDNAMAVFRDPGNARRVREDEENFLDRHAKRVFLVDETGGPLPRR